MVCSFSAFPVPFLHYGSFGLLLYHLGLMDLNEPGYLDGHYCKNCKISLASASGSSGMKVHNPDLYPEHSHNTSAIPAKVPLSCLPPLPLRKGPFCPKQQAEALESSSSPIPHYTPDQRTPRPYNLRGCMNLFLVTVSLPILLHRHFIKAIQRRRSPRCQIVLKKHPPPTLRRPNYRLQKRLWLPKKQPMVPLQCRLDIPEPLKHRRRRHDVNSHDPVKPLGHIKCKSIRDSRATIVANEVELVET